MVANLNGNGTALATTDSTALARYEQPTQRRVSLTPRDMDEAWLFCQRAVKSGMLPPTVRTPEAALMIVMKGEELGISPMQAFASINIINGTPRMSAELVIALVKKRRDLCKYFTLISSDDTQATWETWRVGEEKPTPHTFTIQDAADMGLANKENYKKQAATMLRWRAGMALARLVYPEVTLGLRDPEEMEDVDEQPAKSTQATTTQGQAQTATVVDADVVETPQPDQLEQTPAEQTAAWVARYDACATTTDFEAVHGDWLKSARPQEVKLAISPAFSAAKERLGIQQVTQDKVTGALTLKMRPSMKIKMPDGTVKTADEINANAKNQESES